MGFLDLVLVSFRAIIIGYIVQWFCSCNHGLNLVLDFDFIEEGTEMGAPKYMEWYGAWSFSDFNMALSRNSTPLAKLQSRR